VLKNPGLVSGYEKEIKEWFDAYWSVYGDAGLSRRNPDGNRAADPDLDPRQGSTGGAALA
jgi:hypothetical protein